MKKPEGKYVWTVKVGEKGQIVIPKEARDVFNIAPGDTILLLGDKKQGLAIVKDEKLMAFFDELMRNENTKEENE